jgi:hypothetical protein
MKEVYLFPRLDIPWSEIPAWEKRFFVLVVITFYDMILYVTLWAFLLSNLEGLVFKIGIVLWLVSTIWKTCVWLQMTDSYAFCKG